MKTIITIAAFLAFALMIVRPAAGQDTTDYIELVRKMVMVTLNDGTQKIGYLISDDGREITLETASLGNIVIPKYQIKEIRQINGQEGSYEQSWAEYPYQTRYFFTFNGLPKRRSKNYLKTFPLGLDAQFGITEDVQVGGITTWIGAPIIGTIQGRFDLGRKVHGAVGGYAGTSSRVAFAQDNPDFLAIPYGSLTFGDVSRNFMIGSGSGYASLLDGQSGERSLIMAGGTTPMGTKAGFVLEMLITVVDGTSVGLVTPGIRWHDKVVDGTSGGLVTPGIRWHDKPGSAIQFGLMAAFANGVFVPVSVPALSFYKTLD